MQLQGSIIADYRAIEPAFGALAEADAMISEAHALGIRTIIDMVPNHGSDQHPWFSGRARAGPGSAERSRFWFRPGRGPNGDETPNNWRSIFGGPGWTRVTEPDGTPGEWYLHLFAPEQPDFNWEHPGGAGRVPGRAAVLVRPGRRRGTDRLGRTADQGPGATRHDPR